MDVASLTDAAQDTLGLPEQSPAWFGTVDSAVSGPYTFPTGDTVSLAGLTCSKWADGTLSGLMYGPNTFALTSVGVFPNTSYTGAVLAVVPNGFSTSLTIVATW